ncbi:MAG: hypothetical protein Q8Q23_01325 [bacterium]|nr:hypothetical protein [bacterium]
MSIEHYSNNVASPDLSSAELAELVSRYEERLLLAMERKLSSDKELEEAKDSGGEYPLENERAVTDEYEHGLEAIKQEVGGEKIFEQIRLAVLKRVADNPDTYRQYTSLLELKSL